MKHSTTIVSNDSVRQGTEKVWVFFVSYAAIVK